MWFKPVPKFAKWIRDLFVFFRQVQVRDQDNNNNS
jgi:hypothetical protein